jgi:hypothetical protein
MEEGQVEECRTERWGYCCRISRVWVSAGGNSWPQKRMRNGLGGEAAVSAGPTSPIATSEARAKCEQQQQEEEVGKGSAMDGSLNGADDGGGGGGGGAVGSNASSVAATKRQRNFASDTIFFFL